MKDDLDSREIGGRDFGERGSNRADAQVPILAPMAGDKQARPGRPWRRLEVGTGREHGVDPAVAGNVDRAANAFAPEVGSAELGRCEQQLGIGVDRDPEFLFRPGMTTVVASKPRLDMGDRNSGDFRRKRSAESARRIPLDDQQRGPDLKKQRQKRLADVSDMGVRVDFAGAVEPERWICIETIVGRRHGRVLAREQNDGLKPLLPERSRDRGKLDRFGTRSDDARNCLSQPSP